MSVVPPLANPQIEALSQVLGDCGSGSEISSVLIDLDLFDDVKVIPSGEGLTRSFEECRKGMGTPIGY